MSDEAMLVSDGAYAGQALQEFPRAKSRLWVCMFIIDPTFQADHDYQIRSIIASLRDAVARGVDVRVLVGESATFSIQAVNLAAARLFQIYEIPARFFSASRESHAKYVIIDETDCLLGSHNWTSLSFSHSLEDSLLIRSASVTARLGESFELEWQRGRTFDYRTPEALVSKRLQRKPVNITSLASLSAPTQAECQLLLDGEYVAATEKAIERAKKSIRVAMFLFSSSKALIGPEVLAERLIDSTRRGVSVRVILDRDRKGQAYRSGIVNRPTGSRLAQQGIEVRYDSSRSLFHSKLVTIDERIILLGSHNWTRPSLSAYHEASVLIRSRSVGREAALRFDSLWAVAHGEK